MVVQWKMREQRKRNESKETRRLDVLRATSLLGLARLGGEKLGLDEGQDTTLGDGDTAKELVQLLVVADGELKVTGDDTRLLVVTSGVTSKLEDLGSQVLEDGSEVDC